MQDSINKNVIDEAVGEWRKRLRACVKAKGHHFEHAKRKAALFRAINSLPRKIRYVLPLCPPGYGPK